MAFIGNTVQNQGFTPAIDYFNGNGVTVTFTLSRPIASVAQVIVAVDNVIQNPSSAFNVVGNSITFTSAPLSGTNNIWVEYTSLITTYQGISQDPTVIGDIRATGGYLAEGDFGNSFVDGNLIDYVTGAGRLTVGELDDLVFYHGGTSARSEMMRLSYAGNSYIVGNFGVGDTSPAGSANYAQLSIKGTSGAEISLKAGATQYGYIYGDNGGLRIINPQSGSASGTMQFSTSNTERMRIDSSGNVGIGVSSVETSNFGGTYRVLAVGNGAGYAAFCGQTTATAAGTSVAYLTGNTTGASGYKGLGSVGIEIDGTSTTNATGRIAFYTGSGGSQPERMRITSSGDLFLNTTATFSYANGKMCINADGSGNPGLVVGVNSTSSAYNNIVLGNSTGGVGRIQTNGSATSYLTSSDYRLKKDVTPIQDALGTIESLNPVAFTWNVDNRQDAGFLAHEFQEILPNYADGTKDGVDAEGNPAYQAVDKSGVIPFLVKAIQEQQQIITDLKARIEALEAK